MNEWGECFLGILAVAAIMAVAYLAILIIDEYKEQEVLPNGYFRGFKNSKENRKEKEERFPCD